MKKIAFFDTKPYDRTWFDILAKHYEIAYFEEKLNRHTATLTDGFDAVCAFVNDRVDAAAIDRMHRCGVQLLALRCAGFSNVDMQAAAGKLRVVRVPAYSPHAVAEHTMGLLLTFAPRLHPHARFQLQYCGSDGHRPLQKDRRYHRHGAHRPRICGNLPRLWHARFGV